MDKTCHVAVFVSGNGTNCENLIRYFSGHPLITISLVVSNKPDAYALTRARNLHVETLVIDKETLGGPAFAQLLRARYHIDFIVLAGFLLRVPDTLLTAFPHRIINLHPALLPKYGGKGMYGRHVHEAVKAHGESETGMTVHWVSDEIDGGDIIAQYKTPLLATDTVDDISRKEHELEMRYFPEVVERVILTS